MILTVVQRVMAAGSGLTNRSQVHRIDVLDGWRATSIVLVLVGHLLPIGPKPWAMNGAIASAGMAIFFVLSGFLITSFLLKDQDVPEFLRRRLFRIIPLSWAAISVLVLASQPDTKTVLANYLFVANLPPQHLLPGGGHLWSLCVEVQFYAVAALMVAVAGVRGVYLLLLIGLGVTALRINLGAHLDIVTWLRADEILAGAMAAVVYRKVDFSSVARWIPRWSSPVIFVFVVASAHEASGALNYARPYLAASAVVSALYAFPVCAQKVFCSRAARYVAEVSYALYVVHGMLMDSWLGKGDTFAKYAKRPLLIAATIVIAHMSTFYFERPLTELGKKMGERRRQKAVPAPTSKLDL